MGIRLNSNVFCSTKTKQYLYTLQFAIRNEYFIFRFGFRNDLKLVIKTEETKKIIVLLAGDILL